MKYTITSPAYLPNVEYFIPFLNCVYLLFADHLQYVKRSSITRSFPLNRGNFITIPVKHSRYIATIKSKEIVSDNYWTIIHLKTIRHQYSTYPFFEEYYYDLSHLYQGKHAKLSIFLGDTISFFLNKLKINMQLISNNTLLSSKNLESGLIDFAKDKKNISFLYDKVYDKNGWLNIFQIQSSQIPTISITKKKSDPNLDISILDFLFTHGPEAPNIIRELYSSCFILN